MSLSITSPAFSNGDSIPSKYTCDAGEEMKSVPLSVCGIPSGAKSLAFIMHDPDAPPSLVPGGLVVHWVRYDLPAKDFSVAEGEDVPGIKGVSIRGDGYISPCPPAQYEPSEHRYFFKIYALDTTTLGLPTGATKAEVEKAMGEHILEEAELMGRYKRK